MRTLSIIIAAVSTAVATGSALAYPPESVSWSSTASGCIPDPAALAAGLVNFDIAHGAVYFAAGKSGHIHLTCPVTAISASAVSPTESVITYYNDFGFSGGVNHCVIQVDVLRGNLDNVEHGAELASYSTGGVATTGRQITYHPLSEMLDLDSSYYWVDIDMFRDSGRARCNPLFIGTFLDGPVILGASHRGNHVADPVARAKR